MRNSTRTYVRYLKLKPKLLRSRPLCVPERKRYSSDEQRTKRLLGRLPQNIQPFISRLMVFSITEILCTPTYCLRGPRVTLKTTDRWRLVRSSTCTSMPSSLFSLPAKLETGGSVPARE